MNEKFTGKVHEHKLVSHSPISAQTQEMMERVTKLSFDVQEAMGALAYDAVVDKKGEMRLSSVIFCRGCLQEARLGFEETIQIIDKILDLPTTDLKREDS